MPNFIGKGITIGDEKCTVVNRPLKEYEKRRLILSPESIEIQLPFGIDVEHTLAGKSYHWSRDTNKKTGGATSYKNANDLIYMAKAYTQGVRNGSPDA